ncbi:MAG TPA: putative baseplate assembly protein [Candidatus Eisenbacteria bacterium]|nr:putative baseplate assembly protein [Candidatus Eisenbacteria bacterium]
MPLLLPNLDDRRWADLVEEGRALIPVYGPEWTDHNAHDPGITIVELLSWIAEMDIYALNRVTDADRRKFLKLVGVTTRPPLPAQAVLSILLKGTNPVTLPSGIEFAQPVPDGDPVRFRSLRAATLIPGSLDALQFRDAKGFQDLTPAWLRRRPLYPLGPDPHRGTEFYLGLTKQLPVGIRTSFYFAFSNGHSSPKERARLVEEMELGRKACQPPSSNNPCAPPAPSGNSTAEPAQERNVPPHHGVRMVWEFLTLSGGQPQWRALDPAKAEVEDTTRSLTLNGMVTFTLPAPIAARSLGVVSAKLFYLRCRIAAGAYDAAPQLQGLAFNAVETVESTPAAMSFVILANSTVTIPPAGPPKPNDVVALQLELDSRSRIISLAFLTPSPTVPSFRVLEYLPPKASAEGLLRIEGVFLGFGNGRPSQTAAFPEVLVEPSTFRLYSLEDDTWHDWQIRSDFDSSSRQDFHALLDPTSGIVTFADGESSRVPPDLRKTGAPATRKCLLFAKAESTQGALQNLAAAAITQLARSPHNLALLYDPAADPDGWTVFQSQFSDISNPLPILNGAAEETIALAAGRADQLVVTSPRAVTLADYERLALSAPGTRVARVKALANLHPSFPCFAAPGMITVVVLPFLPAGRPYPSPGLLRVVTAYLNRRRIIGTRVEVVGPKYITVGVEAEVQSAAGIDRTRLRQSIVNALNNYFDPLTGGPAGTGWPFGRDVYRSEILRVIDQVSGVDHVNSMDLLTDGCEATCGNVCLGPISLVAAGEHAITVL